MNFEKMRKVIIGRNTMTNELTVYSNREKVYKLHESRLSISYNQFCIAVKKGVTVEVPADFGFWDKVVFKEYRIN